MCDLAKGRIEPCKNSFSGINNIYLMPFVNYPYYSIVVDEGVELFTFPSTNIYRYELRADGNSFDQNISIDDSGIAWNQSLSVVLKKKDLFLNNELKKLNNLELRVIVETREGKFFILGLRNGVTMDFSASTGGAKNSLNGYNLTFEGNEKYLSPFIDDLQDAGFIIDDGETFNLLFQNGDNIILENNDNLITQNG